MRIYLIGVVMACLTAGSASAQHANIGIKAGLNLNNVVQNNNTLDPKPGVNFGLIGHTHLGQKIALQPEVMFSAQGAKVGNSTLNLNYINVPILVQYMFDNGFRLQAGPQLGILVNANSKTDQTRTNIKSAYKTVDAGLSVGASYVNPPTGFGVDVRYNHGFRDIHENDAVSQKNKTIQLGLFYLFNHRS